MHQLNTSVYLLQRMHWIEIQLTVLTKLLQKSPSIRLFQNPKNNFWKLAMFTQIPIVYPYDIYEYFENLVKK
jgi:hypothetical protein